MQLLKRNAASRLGAGAGDSAEVQVRTRSEISSSAKWPLEGASWDLPWAPNHVFDLTTFLLFSVYSV